MRFILFAAREPYAEADQAHAFSSAGEQLRSRAPKLLQGGSRPARSTKVVLLDSKFSEMLLQAKEGIAAFLEKRPPK